MYYGLSYKLTRRLAYQFALKLKRLRQIHKVLPKWRENEEAGIDWMLLFMKRHTDLSLRLPQATSLGRATAFNRHNVKFCF